jgi:hypothetical protein
VLLLFFVWFLWLLPFLCCHGRDGLLLLHACQIQGKQVR